MISSNNPINISKEDIITLYTRNLMLGSNFSCIDIGDGLYCKYNTEDDIISLEVYKGDYKKLKIPNIIDKVNESVFFYNDLYTIDLNNVIILDKYAFFRCNFLHEIIGDKVTFVGDYCFFGTKFTQVNLPSCLSVGKYAFFDCNDLKYVILPNCEFIDDLAFVQSYNLQKLVVKKGCKISSFALEYSNISISDVIFVD